MHRFLNRRIQIPTLLLLAFIALFTFTPNVLADNGVVQGSAITSGETIENDVLLNGTDVSLDGTVDGDAFVVGRTVVVNGDVKGSLFVLGENVVMNGKVEGSVYSMAVSFSHLSDAVIGRSLYFLGVSLQTEKESTIDRDLTAVTLGIQQAGTVGRNPKIIAGIGEIGQLILNRINAATSGVTFSNSGPGSESGSLIPQIAGLEIYAGSIGPAGSSQRSILAQEEPTGEDGEEIDEPITFVDWIVDRLRQLVTYLLIGGLLIWLFPNHLDNWANQVRKKPLAAGAWGLVAYVMGFVAHSIFFLLILVVGISFAVVTLWALAWAWWGVGFSALALSFSLFLVAVAFVSKIIVAYLIGSLLFERFGSKPDMRKPWPMLVGLIIYVLLSGIPYLGWAISLIVTFLGLGGMWLAFTGRNEPQEMAAEVEPTA